MQDVNVTMTQGNKDFKPLLPGHNLDHSDSEEDGPLRSAQSRRRNIVHSDEEDTPLDEEDIPHGRDRQWGYYDDSGDGGYGSPGGGYPEQQDNQEVEDERGENNEEEEADENGEDVYKGSEHEVDYYGHNSRDNMDVDDIENGPQEQEGSLSRTFCGRNK
ncbi:hypothetical protein MSAN_02449400 [Mycena sanguinolenta]|uniref:Uncharacterized protein n=1 Tax=Mycena sanguinolenta TaxID=230812 RepID=A0A8H7CCQ1_9AGAR|nr:hypothetical protein MSAN_02449400 [Mycena sanguinolenta]